MERQELRRQYVRDSRVGRGKSGSVRRLSGSYSRRGGRFCAVTLPTSLHIIHSLATAILLLKTTVWKSRFIRALCFFFSYQDEQSTLLVVENAIVYFDAKSKGALMILDDCVEGNVSAEQYVAAVLRTLRDPTLVSQFATMTSRVRRKKWRDMALELTAFGPVDFVESFQAKDDFAVWLLAEDCEYFSRAARFVGEPLENYLKSLFDRLSTETPESSLESEKESAMRVLRKFRIVE